MKTERRLDSPTLYWVMNIAAIRAMFSLVASGIMCILIYRYPFLFGFDVDILFIAARLVFFGMFLAFAVIACEARTEGKIVEHRRAKDDDL